MSDSDTAKARLILEVRQGGVTDDTVLRAMESIPRPLFVPQAFQERSFENVALPIGRHQTVSQPVVVGLMTQALDLNDRMKVLEIGTGSGYQAAILSKLCRRLYTMERHPPLLEEAEARFRELRLTNVTAVLAAGSMGW
ncbi:MAG: protein-L-isoaspartate O-methyltransferase, partial [Rhodospirillales bacterium]|nr:protein-L-isoaspartate O-methyltransferase [Rhodospirillales bacterium]